VKKKTVVKKKGKCLKEQKNQTEKMEQVRDGIVRGENRGTPDKRKNSPPSEGD